MTAILAVVVMILVAGGLALRMLVTGEPEVRRPGCGSFTHPDEKNADGACGVCGAASPDDCRVDEKEPEDILHGMRN